MCKRKHRTGESGKERVGERERKNKWVRERERERESEREI